MVTAMGARSKSRFIRPSIIAVSTVSSNRSGVFMVIGGRGLSEIMRCTFYAAIAIASARAFCLGGSRSKKPRARAAASGNLFIIPLMLNRG